MKFFDSHDALDITVRNLPHYWQSGRAYFVTFRLADSLPQSKLREIAEERRRILEKNDELSEEEKKRQLWLFSKRVDEWLDNGYGCRLLQRKDLANVVEESILFYEDVKYEVPAYVVMPNHVHLLLVLFDNVSLVEVMQGIKSYTSHSINRLCGRTGILWSVESYDRIIRSQRHLDYVIQYIYNNIQQGGICWRILL